MIFVRTPQQGHQDVDVEEISRHLLFSFQFSNPFCGDLGCVRGRIKISNPLMVRVGTGAAIPRRTSSDTAFPRPTERVSAYCFTTDRTSSSRFRVVRIGNNDDISAKMMSILTQ